MGKVGLWALLPLCALASCGAPPDNPENVPLSGKWRDEGKLVSVTVGGTAIDQDEIPNLDRLRAKVTKSNEFCGEPRFRSKEEFQDAMDETNPGKCEIQSVEGDGELVHAKGVCNGLQLPGVDGKATLKGESRMAADKVVYDMTINVIVRDKLTGEGEAVSMKARRTMTRLGDC